MKIVILGHSHIICMRQAQNTLLKNTHCHDLEFILIRDKEFWSPGGNSVQTTSIHGANTDLIIEKLQAINADLAIICIAGNQHYSSSLWSSSIDNRKDKLNTVNKNVYSNFSEWMSILVSSIPNPIIVIPPPPPIERQEDLRRVGSSLEPSRPIEPEDKNFRLELWREHCRAISQAASEFGVHFVEHPPTVFDAEGFRAEDCCGNDPSHGNNVYGARVLSAAVKSAEEIISKCHISAADGTRASKLEKKSAHPYKSLPNYCFWKESVSGISFSSVDPVTDPRFSIHPTDKVATAGSCFAQHISKRLRQSGFNFFVVENGGEDEQGAQSRGFYDFSARYGNIYTARQLLQLFDRAFGYYTPLERVWHRNGGGYCDPYRPRIEPEGFLTENDVLKDSERHLAAVKKMFEQLDVFVFTLGLTECWVSRLDGAAYPLAPGVAGGEFDAKKYRFENFTVETIGTDLRAFLEKLWLVNSKARVVLTVSPVPLAATAVDRHILVSNTYSKAVLRVVAEDITNRFDKVLYFPSYEIITGQHVGNAYYGNDRRSVTERGVDHVMDVFMSRLTTQRKQAVPSNVNGFDQGLMAEIEALAEAACDEEMLSIRD